MLEKGDIILMTKKCDKKREEEVLEALADLNILNFLWVFDLMRKVKLMPFDFSLFFWELHYEFENYHKITKISTPFLQSCDYKNW